MQTYDEEGSVTLFGSEKRPWSAADWTASDDRVRGGKSQSYLDISEEGACFYGTLDIKTLGGAGFASQRTTGDDRTWDLSEYAGIQLNIVKGDKKRYTFTLKDELLPLRDDGREQSTVSYEIDFDLPPQAEPGDTCDRSVFIPWKSFTPTFRGRVKKDAEPLDTAKIKRISIMMRSFFGTQEGDFSLTLSTVKALKKVPNNALVLQRAPEESQLENGAEQPTEDGRYGRLRLNLYLVKIDLQYHRRLSLTLLGGACFLLYILGSMGVQRK